MDLYLCDGFGKTYFCLFILSIVFVQCCRFSMSVVPVTFDYFPVVYILFFFLLVVVAYIIFFSSFSYYFNRHNMLIWSVIVIFNSPHSVKWLLRMDYLLMLLLTSYRCTMVSWSVFENILVMLIWIYYRLRMVFWSVFEVEASHSELFVAN